KLEDFKRRLDETSKRGSEGFQGISKEVQRLGEQSHGVNNALGTMSTVLRSTFGEFNKTIATSVSGMGGFLAALRGTPGALAGSATAIAQVLDALGGKIVASQTAARNLRTELGLVGDYWINFQTRLGARTGQSPEEVIKNMTGWAHQFHDLVRGAGS